MYVWLAISDRADYQHLVDHLSVQEFGLGEVIDMLQLHLADDVKGVLIETPYVDKDYRSTFYNYYAKKGGSYSPYCARLHFFGAGWSLEEAPLRFVNGQGEVTDAMISDGYFGFMVLRPTRIYTVGRSVISPEAVLGVSGSIIEYRHKGHVLGNRVTVSGFPYMQQHSDIAVCAHAACWAILRHYSERFSLYEEVLLHDVSKLGREFDPGGLLPSLGITASDAERIFAAAGTYPLWITRGETPEEHQQFYSQLIAYLASGFPLFGVQSARQHAVAIVGYRKEDQIAATTQKTSSAWDHTASLIVIDDNYFPYLEVPKAPGVDDEYGTDAFDAFIVPLPEKMFLPASAIDELAQSLRSDAPVQFDELEQEPHLVVRHFLTTAAAWHRHLRKTINEYPHEFSQAALELTLPQFLWIVEYANPAQWQSGRVQVRMVFDATAGTHEPFPAFLVHDKKGALWLDRANRRPMAYQPFVSAFPDPRVMDSSLVSH